MNTPAPIYKQSGVMLLEALIAILIFSLGILAIVGLQAASIKSAGDAKYRSDASLLANQLIGQMWVSDRTTTTLQSSFGTGGTDYSTWQSSVAAALPGTSTNPPSVTFTTDNSTATPSSVATITIYWQSPSETTTHQYVTVAQIVQ